MTNATASVSSISFVLPEGNHRVTVRYTDAATASRATVKAEARRLMVEPTHILNGDTRTFVVNVRTPALTPPPEHAPGATAVRLKPQELTSPTWDNKLTLEIIGAEVYRDEVTIELANVPTVYLAGDSTVTDQVAAPAASWGQMLPRFFKDGIAIANHAESGETLKSFLAALRLEKILASLRKGDWLLIQFGHNDQKTQWPQTYAEAATTYKDYLRIYVGEARRHGATPILVTSPERRNFDSKGQIAPSLGDYPNAVREIARELHVSVIDLNAMSKAFYEALGEQRSALAFNDDGKDRTHHNNYGAYALAHMVVEGIRATDKKLAAHLADDTDHFDPRTASAAETFSLPESTPLQQQN